MKSTIREFARYTALNIIAMLSLSGYILADTFFIANGIGAYGLAALNFALPVFGLVFGIALMLGIGGATKYTILKSQGDGVAANKIFTMTLLIMFAFAGIFVVGGLFFAPRLATVFGAYGHVFTMSKTYLQVILVSSPLLMANSVLVCFVRNDGAPRTAMLSMASTSMANIGLDYVFIFMLDMGMFGAAFATTTANVIGFAIVAWHFARKRGALRLVRTKITRAAAGIFAIGLPTLMSEISISVVLVVFNAIIFRLSGNMGVAAYGVIANILIVVVAMFNGIAQGVQPLISKYYGEGNGAKTKLVTRYAMLLMAAMAAVVYAVVFLFARPIAGAFNSEGNALLQQLAVAGLRVYFTGVVFAGFNIIISMYFTSTDRPRPAQVISLLRGLVVILPLVFLLSAAFGVTGVWLTFPMAELLVCMGCGGYLLWRKKKTAYAESRFGMIKEEQARD